MHSLILFFHCIVMSYNYDCILTLQGDMGLIGLPGFSGIKGEKVRICSFFIFLIFTFTVEIYKYNLMAMCTAFQNVERAFSFQRNTKLPLHAGFSVAVRLGTPNPSEYQIIWKDIFIAPSHLEVRSCSPSPSFLPLGHDTTKVESRIRKRQSQDRLRITVPHYSLKIVVIHGNTFHRMQEGSYYIRAEI